MTFKQRLLFSVASLQWWQRYAVTILFLTAIALLWWFCSYRFLWGSLQQLTQQNKELHQPIAVASPQEAEIIPDDLALPLATESIDATFEKRLGAFFTLKSMSEATRRIVTSSTQEQLQLVTYILSPVQTKDWYTYFEMRLVLVGEFFKLVNFFERLQKYDNSIIEQCEMTLSGSRVQCSCTLLIILPPI